MSRPDAFQGDPIDHQGLDQRADIAGEAGAADHELSIRNLMETVHVSGGWTGEAQRRLGELVGRYVTSGRIVGGERER